MYIVEENGHAVVIDPCRDTAAGDGLTVDWLIVTHEHYDHISGVNEWKEKTGAPLLCSRACAERIENPKKNMSRHFDAFCMLQSWTPVGETRIDPVSYTCRAERTFEDTYSFLWQGHRFSLMEIPGHSPGSVGIMLDNTDFFSGDSLIAGSPIELRFPGGSAAAWEETGKKRIEALPDGVMIRPGHFESFILRRAQRDGTEENR